MHRLTSPKKVTIAVLVCAVLASAACSDVTDDTDSNSPAEREPATSQQAEPSESSTDSTDFPDGWRPKPLTWGECDHAAYERIECATLEVPLDWADPDGEQITLALGRIAATGEAIGPLLSNPGGPGGSGLEFLALGAFTPELSERFDMISWDPRGVGDSTPIECDGSIDDLWDADSGPDDDAERSELTAAAEAVAADCAAAEGELLEHVHTANVARDMEAIRLALGGEPINYIGFSYGTHIGQLYAEMFGPNLRAMVLDGVVDPALAFEEFLLGQTAAFDEAFEAHAGECADAGQACGVEDLRAAYDRVAAELESSRRESDLGPVGPSELATAAAFVSYQQDGWRPLGDALADALEGDFSGIRLLADSYRDLGAYGPYAAVVCTDSERPMGFEDFEAFEQRAIEVSARFGAAIANEMLPCAVWGADPQDSAGAVTAPEAPPILVVGNTGDPATPIENAEAVAESLSSGVLLVVDSDGHVAFGSNSCATAAIEEYLIDLTLPEPDTVCA